MPAKKQLKKRDGRIKNPYGVPGSVREHPPGSGKYQARFPSKDGKRLTVPGSPFDSPNEAWEALAEAHENDQAIKQAEREAERRKAGLPSAYTVATLCRDYIRDRANDPTAPLSQRTKSGYYQVLRDQIQDPSTRLQHLAISTVTRDDIEAWRNTLLRSPRKHQKGRYKGKKFHSKSSIRHAGRLLAAAFNWALQKGFINQVPVVNPKPPRSKFAPSQAATRRQPVFPTWAETATIVAAPHRHQDRLLLALLAWGGLRWGEAIALACKDVDARTPQVRVRRVFANERLKPSEWVYGPSGKPYKKHKVVEEPPKTGGNDAVPLPNKLHTELLKLATQRNNPDALLFQAVNYRDEPSDLPLINQSRFRATVWLPAIGAAGLPQMQVKDLRAYAASALLDAGANELEAKQLLRHSAVTTTQEHYMRARDSQTADTSRTQLPPKMATKSLQVRLNWLFEQWLKKFPQTRARLIGGQDDDVRVGISTRPHPRNLGKARKWARENGFTNVSKVGALRRDIVDAYLTAFPGEAVKPDVTVSGYLARKAARENPGDADAQPGAQTAPQVATARTTAPATRNGTKPAKKIPAKRARPRPQTGAAPRRHAPRSGPTRP